MQADMAKSGQSDDEGRGEDYDAVFPVHPLVIKEGKRYIERSWSKHGFRSNRPTELRTAPDKYARLLTGHSVRTGTPGISVSEGRYLGLVPEDLVNAVLLVAEDP